MGDLLNTWRPSSHDRSREERAEAERLERVRRAERDPSFFCTHYLPHYFTTPPDTWQLSTLDGIGDKKPDAYAAPRGHGKTTWIAFGMTTWSLVTRRKKYVVYIGPTQASARMRIDEIKREMEENERLIADFGVVVSGEKRMLGDKAAADDLRLANGGRIMARGAGQSMRGVRDRANRPDLVIVDDVDKDNQGKPPSSEQTEGMINWLKRVVFPLTGAEGMKLYVIGNIMARNTLLGWCLKSPRFRSFIFRAIQDDGTPLMPALWTLERLLEMRENIGTDAFETEYQNNPPSVGARPFREEWLDRRWSAEMISALEDQAVWVFLDPSKAKTASADFQAIVSVMRDWKNGAIYIIKADIDRRPPIQLIERLVGFCEAIGVSRIAMVGIESVQFQEFFADIFDQVCRTRGVTLRVERVQQHLSKYDRVSRLVPHVEGGRVFFPPDEEWDGSMKLLHDQLASFPDGKHDDGPDAFEGAVALSDFSRRSSSAIVAPWSPFSREMRGGRFDWADRDRWPDGYQRNKNGASA